MIYVQLHPFFPSLSLLRDSLLGCPLFKRLGPTYYQFLTQGLQCIVSRERTSTSKSPRHYTATSDVHGVHGALTSVGIEWVLSDGHPPHLQSPSFAPDPADSMGEFNPCVWDISVLEPACAHPASGEGYWLAKSSASALLPALLGLVAACFCYLL